MRKDNKKNNTNNLVFFRGIALAVVLTASLVVTQPIYTVDTFAAAIEDCDLDGYDDHTGNPVPWIGFDSTKGEEVPAGWDGHTIYKSKKAFEDAQKEDEEDDKSDLSGSNSSSSSSSGSSSSSSASSSQTSSSASSSQSDSSSNGSQSGGSSKSSKSANNSSKTSSKQTGNSSKNGSKSNSSSKIDSSSKLSGNANSSQTSNVEETTVEENNEETTSVDNINKKGKKKKKINKKETGTEEVTEITESVDLQKVLNTKGTLEVSEVDGSNIHAGSDLIITGAGFVGNVEDITIEIHSDNAINLASINTGEDGSFESQVYIPEDLPEGTHEIVLLYQGQQIASQSIEIGPAVANTFFKALTVGFSTDNKGLIPGLLILAGLFVAGVITALFGGLFGKKENIR